LSGGGDFYREKAQAHLLGSRGRERDVDTHAQIPEIALGLRFSMRKSALSQDVANDHLTLGKNS